MLWYFQADLFPQDVYWSTKHFLFDLKHVKRQVTPSGSRDFVYSSHGYRLRCAVKRCSDVKTYSWYFVTILANLLLPAHPEQLLRTSAPFFHNVQILLTLSRYIWRTEIGFRPYKSPLTKLFRSKIQHVSLLGLWFAVISGTFWGTNLKKNGPLSFTYLSTRSIPDPENSISDFASRHIFKYHTL